ncbi:unnamed protein product [Allacma fusca]|uniref:Uncharacterized protein n=1 Tax=Allacma fusca TaxID=39272 RepID=A0A8J2KAS3_9HEXA|nr:unnamed protein product [Allacma fusca]
MGRRPHPRLLRSWVFMVSLCLSWCSLSWCYKEKVRVNFGGEIMSNGIGEPSCEELRAMWRYHKRQSRAELTNRIPTFDSMYWQLPAPIQGFGPINSRKLSSRARGKGGLYGPGRHGLYGHINYYGPSTPRQLRPMEQLVRTLPPKQPPALDSPSRPVVHLSPPPKDTSSGRSSSFQQVQQILQQQKQAELDMDEERIEAQRPSEGGRFGTLVLSPPEGQDGRVANKAPLLMTPFEKLRFGHVQLEDLPQGPVLVKRGLFYYPIRATRPRERQGQGLPTTTTASPPSPSLPHHASMPTVFSFWQRQLVPQDPPPSHRMVDSLPACSLVQGLQCSLNSHCSCLGNGLFYSCFLGRCQLLSPLASLESTVMD